MARVMGCPALAGMRLGTKPVSSTITSTRESTSPLGLAAGAGAGAGAAAGGAGAAAGGASFLQPAAAIRVRAAARNACLRMGGYSSAASAMPAPTLLRLNPAELGALADKYRTLAS